MAFASCISFGGGKSQTHFSSFFHIQATSQQTLVFTLMLIKVNYFVVLGHWYKTCILFSLCYVQKFKISRCIQHKLMTYLCFSMWFKAFLFFSLCLNYFCFYYAKCSHDSCRILFLSSSIFSPLWCQNYSSACTPSWIITCSQRRSSPWEVMLAMKTPISNSKSSTRIFPPQRWNLINPFCRCLFSSYRYKSTGTSTNDLKRTF